MQKQKIINFFAWTFVSIVGLAVGLVALLMVSGLGVLARRDVDYGFNLGVATFIIFIFFIAIILIS